MKPEFLNIFLDDHAPKFIEKSKAKNYLQRKYTIFFIKSCNGHLNKNLGKLTPLDVNLVSLTHMYTVNKIQGGPNN
jgi:hypothetical protein